MEFSLAKAHKSAATGVTLDGRVVSFIEEAPLETPSPDGPTNLRSRDDLYFGSAADRDAYFDGNEGFDFVDKTVDAPVMPPRYVGGTQQQQRVKSQPEMEQQRKQQQQMQMQM